MVFPYIGSTRENISKLKAPIDRKRQRLPYISQNDRLPLFSLFFSLERTRSFHSVMNDSWSALSWKYDPIQMITTFLKTPVVFPGFGRGEAMIFPEVRPTFSTWSPPPSPPPPALRFTRALPNGPQKQKEKRLWTQYSRLDIKHLLRWDLRPLPVHGVDSRCDVNFVIPCMLSGHVSQGPFGNKNGNLSIQKV